MKNHCLCIGLSLGYNQSVVLSKSLNVFFFTLIIFVFIPPHNVLIFLLNIYGIKCTGSVSSALLVKTLSSSFLFSYFSVFLLSIFPLFISKRDLFTAVLLSPLFMVSTISTTEPAQHPLLLSGRG